MKYLKLAILLLMTSCGSVVQPNFILYIERTKANLESSIAIGVQVAEEYAMAYKVAAKNKYTSDFEIVLEATESSWLYRNLGIGSPAGHSFVLALKPDSIYLTLSYAGDGDQSIPLIDEWVKQLIDREIAHSLSDRQW